MDRWISPIPTARFHFSPFTLRLKQLTHLRHRIQTFRPRRWLCVSSSRTVSPAVPLPHLDIILPTPPSSALAAEPKFWRSILAEASVDGWVAGRSSINHPLCTHIPTRPNCRDCGVFTQPTSFRMLRHRKGFLNELNCGVKALHWTMYGL